MGAINDVLTGATPQFWNGVDLQFELAIFYGMALASCFNLDFPSHRGPSSNP